MNLYSDPVVSIPGIAGQFGQFELWMQNGRAYTGNASFVPCGRLRQAPQFFRLSVQWADNPPPTNPEFLGFFVNICLQRDAIRQFVPDVNSPFWAISHRYAAFPQCVFTMSHWLTPIFTVPGILNLRWILYYGDVSGLYAAEFGDGTIDQTLLNTDVTDHLDAGWNDSDPTSIDTNAISGGGWGLYLIATHFDLADADTNVVSFRVYSGYQLNLAAAQKRIASKTPIFEATSPSVWEQFHNAINLPAHTVTLTPFGS